MDNVVKEFQNGKINVDIFGATEEQLDKFEDTVCLKWASERHLKEHKDYTNENCYIYAVPRNNCIYKYLRGLKLTSKISMSIFEFLVIFELFFSMTVFLT